jgi:hypothetical protein
MDRQSAPDSRVKTGVNGMAAQAGNLRSLSAHHLLFRLHCPSLRLMSKEQLQKNENA